MKIKQIIVIRKDLGMRKGKMCAQAAHASLGIFTDMMTAYSHGKNDEWTMYQFAVENNSPIDMWIKSTTRKIVVGVNSENELLDIYEKAKEQQIPVHLVTDLGKTEFGGVATNTCLALGPALDENIDKLTGHLELL